MWTDINQAILHEHFIFHLIFSELSLSLPGLRGDEAQQVRVLGPGGVRAARRAVEAEDQDLDSLLRTILFLTCNYMFSYVHDM